MADKELFTQKDTATFEDDPVEYCKRIYAEARRRNDDLKEINRENRLLYEGIDENLEKRKSDPNVERSSVFVPELKPAIDTRVSSVITKVEEREFPVTFRPDYENPTPEQKDQALNIERIINGQLRECGYLSGGDETDDSIFKDHILSAEMYRSPSTVKVGWESVYEKEPQVIEPSEQEIEGAFAVGRTPPAPTVRFIDKYKGGRPVVDLLEPDEFLYEPGISNFQKDSEYAIHAIWVSWSKLMSMAQEFNWDIKKLKKLKEEIIDSDSGGETEERFEDSVEGEKGIGFQHGIRDGKILITENYVRIYNEAGEEEIHQAVMVALKEIISNKRAPHKGIKFSFVPLTSNRLPGTIEGLSTVDVGKQLQFLYNETFNQHLDGVSYRLFPPIIQESGTTFKEKPRWEPGALWKVTNPEGLRPFIENPGPMPDLVKIEEAVSAKLRNTTNAEDTSQGFQAQEYEKATATKLRASGSARRSMPTHKRYGEALIRVAKIFLALNQQYREDGAGFVMALVIDVPSLTNVSDPEAEKQEMILLLSQAMQSPLYQGPVGQLKIRNMTEDMFRLFKKIDTDRYVPSEEEVKQEISDRAAVQSAMQEKEAVQEQIGLEAQTGGSGEV